MVVSFRIQARFIVLPGPTVSAKPNIGVSLICWKSEPNKRLPTLSLDGMVGVVQTAKKTRLRSIGDTAAHQFTTIPLGRSIGQEEILLLRKTQTPNELTKNETPKLHSGPADKIHTHIPRTKRHFLRHLGQSDRVAPQSPAV